mgnify:CR=1 FL=1|jgi:hypothetical protein|nr:MAG TPA: hypothetical protein [Caudoviricetes sp.]
METEEKKTPNQKLDVTIDISFRFTNDGIVVESSKIESGNVDIGKVPITDNQWLLKGINDAQQANRPLLNI